MLRRGTATAIIWLRLRTHSSWRISPAPSAGCRLECPMCAIGFLTLMPPRRGIGGPLAARATKVASQSVSTARNHVLPCTGALRGPTVRIAWPSPLQMTRVLYLPRHRTSLKSDYTLIITLLDSLYCYYIRIDSLTCYFHFAGEPIGTILTRGKLIECCGRFRRTTL